MKDKSFHIQLQENWFCRGDVLTDPEGFQFIVTKVYRDWWWRKLLRWLGFKLPYYEGRIKVKNK